MPSHFRAGLLCPLALQDVAANNPGGDEAQHESRHAANDHHFHGPLRGGDKLAEDPSVRGAAHQRHDTHHGYNYARRHNRMLLPLLGHLTLTSALGGSKDGEEAGIVLTSI